MSGARQEGYPRRIVCLTGETAEVLHRLGAGDRVVGSAGPVARLHEIIAGASLG
jgi:ABC-type hemin transport system substrate-binding protein